MDIQLKQNEIAEAVRNHVAEKIGINLTGKHLDIQFSMGRGPNALVANLSITEKSAMVVPGYTDRDTPVEQAKADSKPNVTLAADNTGKSIDPELTEKTIPAEEFVAAPEAVASDSEQTASTAADTSAPAASTTNLFGND